MKSAQVRMILFILLCHLCACSPVGGKAIVIVATDNQFDSQALHNAIAKIIVEHAYDGYEFQVSTASSMMNWQSMITGEIDIDIESWTDNVFSYAQDVANGDIVDIGVLVADSAQGLYVPRYVIYGDKDRGIKALAPGLKTVADLKQYAPIFPKVQDIGKGRIYGAIPGWMADEVLYKKYLYYGLDEALSYTRLSNEESLYESLTTAYDSGEPWVGYCYEPAWVTGKMDLILLQDAPFDEALYYEGQCAFPSQQLKIVSSNQFASKAPELLPFFEKYQTGSVLISKTLAYMDETGASHAESAIWFLREYDALIDQWLPAENAAKLRGYLSLVD